MHDIALDQQDEAVKRFVLSLPVDPQASVLELNGQAVAWVVPASAVATNGDEPWTKQKNDRRCDLIDKKYAGESLTLTETLELAQLQEQMQRYRQRLAPWPLEGARRLHQELLEQAGHAQPDA